METEPLSEVEVTKTKTCPHLPEDIVEEKGSLYCSCCGEELEKNVFHGKEWRFYSGSDSKGGSSDPNRVQARKNDERSIYKDVETLPFSDRVKAEANELFKEVTKGKIFRGAIRRGIVCACVFYAHKKLGFPQTQEKLTSIFSIHRKKTLEGMKFVKHNASKDSFVHYVNVTPVDLIDDIMSKFNATTEQKDQVITLYENVKNKSFKLNGSRPQSVGAGTVFYWVTKNSIDISLKDFAKIVGLSELTITKMVKEIGDILNKQTGQ